MTRQKGAEVRENWKLDASICFLNHGSFGACPTEVLEVQRRLREQMEAEPVRFFERELADLLARARCTLAAFVGADADDLAFVPNATTAINAVLRSFPFESGDEVLITDHEYNASKNIAEYAAAERGARVVTAHVPFPCSSDDLIVEGVLAAVSPRTRLALVDHVTSQTALVFPIERIVRQLEARGIPTLVDAAHAPGMVPVNLMALKPAFYTSNCHKWLCAPKGAAFLFTRKDYQTTVRPTNISHGANEPGDLSGRYRAEFDWTGTSDPTSYLCVPAAIEFLGSLLPGGMDEVMKRNRALALEGRRIVASALGSTALPCPDGLIGSMATLPLPPLPAALRRSRRSSFELDPLHDVLFHHYGIDVPIMGCPAHPSPMIRISAQMYNAPSDYERLADALREILADASVKNR